MITLETGACRTKKYRVSIMYKWSELIKIKLFASPPCSAKSMLPIEINYFKLI